MEELVSIITPAYNVEQYLEETVNSVIQQSYSNWELLIIDDCSTDNTYLIASKLSKIDSRIKVYRFSQNSGVAAARNYALSKANGKYVAFLDSDDIWYSDKLTKQIKFMENNGICFSFTYYCQFSDKTKKIRKIVKARKRVCSKTMFKYNPIGCLTVVINKSKVGTFKMPNIKYGEDCVTWESILSQGFKAYCLCEICAAYRLRSNSATHNKTSAAKKRWLLLRKYYRFSLFKSIFYFCNYIFYSLKIRLF